MPLTLPGRLDAGYRKKLPGAPHSIQLVSRIEEALKLALPSTPVLPPSLQGLLRQAVNRSSGLRRQVAPGAPLVPA